VRRLSGALGVAFLLAMTACTSTVPGSPVAAPQEQHAPTAAPSGLEKFYGQPLTWGGCRSYAIDDISRELYDNPDLQCSRLRVPVDYTRPDGPAAQIGLLRVEATDKANRIGAVVLNPGGPGESGMTAAASIAKQDWTGEMAKRFDLVGFDPRGVGASTPKVRCLSDKETDAQRLEPPKEGPNAVAEIEKENQALADKCAQNSGKDLLANLGTRDVVKDMDVLRSVLGDRKLTYLGYSYGTRIGTAYAEAFPGNVRAMVLDGAVDPKADRVASIISQAKGFRKALDEFGKDCAARPGCPLGGDATRTEAVLEQLLKPLKTKPLTVGSRKLSYSDASTAVAQAMYSDNLWDPLRQGLTGLTKGDGTILLRLADIYDGRDDDGKYSGAQDAFMAIRCVDDPQVKDRAVVEDEARRITAEIPKGLLDDDDDLKPALDACAFWPAPNTMSPHEPKTPGLPKVLVVSTTNDPATPYQSGVNLAKQLNASLLTVEGTRHTAYHQGITCVDKIADDYLLRLTEPPADAKCS
jgi:pimeloyl-ACP methyl ester carboxylesterase